MTRILTLAFALVLTIGTSGCSKDNKQQQPSAAEQQRIQDEQRKAAEQQRQLTSGYDKSMGHVAPNTGTSPQGTDKQQSGTRKTRSQNQLQQQPTDQQRH